MYTYKKNKIHYKILIGEMLKFLLLFSVLTRLSFLDAFQTISFSIFAKGNLKEMHLFVYFNVLECVLDEHVSGLLQE